MRRIKNEIIDFYIINDNLSYTEFSFDEYKNSYTTNGNLLSITKDRDKLIVKFSAQDNYIGITQILSFDKNLKLLSEETILTDSKTLKVTYLDENEEETKSQSFFDPVYKTEPFCLTLNGEKIWIKNTFESLDNGVKKQHTWISKDEFNYEINIKELLKSETKEAGMALSTGFVATPIIYADPINNSIIVQYWLLFYLNGQPVERFFYYSLDSNFKLRNAYKVKLTRYPFGNRVDQQIVAITSHLKDDQKNIVFRIDKKPRHWKGNSQIGSDNAFDFMFSQQKLRNLSTIINIKNTQYLFIDRVDGSTTGYIFKR